MSAVVGIFGPRARARDARRMLEAMRLRGRDILEVRDEGDAAIGVARQEWQSGQAFAGPDLVLSGGGVTIAADASLYYRDELARALGLPVDAARESATSVLHRAWRAHAAGALGRLEGDFALVVLDRRTGEVTCARDFGGKRALHFTLVGGDTLVVASTVSGVLAHPSSDSTLNLAAFAEVVGGLSGSPTETTYRDVRRIPPGCALTWRLRGEPELRRWWEIPAIVESGSIGHEEAARELLRLLRDATRERLEPGRVTTVWMSGGWDSPAIFGVAMDETRRDPSLGVVRPISISFPQGSAGREDELIAAIARFRDTPVHWLHADDIPILHDPVQGAARRDEPFAHAFEHWNRALMRGTRGLDARVALDGIGGDQLFQVSRVYFADLLLRGRLLTLRREWKIARERGVSSAMLARTTTIPALPWWLREAVEAARGARLRSHLEWTLPPWFRPDFVRRHRLLEREREHNPPRRGESPSAHETGWYLRNPYSARIPQTLGGFAEEEGVESRSPLFDPRVIRFAATRPRWERSSGGTSKILLRRAVRGLLPDLVLAPRRDRTGTTTEYLLKGLALLARPEYAVLLEDPLLAQLGVVDRQRLAEHRDRFLRGRSTGVAVALFLTLQGELWLRTRDRPASEGVLDAR